MSVLNEKIVQKEDYISEVWESNSLWEFKEPTPKEKSVVDGKAIIGIIEGQFFVPDGKSRNERFYPKALWEDVLKAKPMREKLDNLLMFGMIGHEDKSITEEDLRKGDVSHIIADLWIDESGRGMGKAYILNTDSGKNLYIYIKAGAKLKTSSRARGKFQENEKKDGLPVVDSSSFYLETFDFVINPGFEETTAELSEKLKKEGGTVVENIDAVKAITESNEKLQSQLKSTISEVAVLKIEKDSILNENKKLAEKANQFSFLESVDKSIVEALSEFDESDWNNVLNSKIRITGALRETSYVHNSVSYDAIFLPVKSSKIPMNKFETVLKNTMNEWESKNIPVDAVFVKRKDNSTLNSNGVMILWKAGQRPMNASESVQKLIIEENHDLFEGYGVPLTKAYTREQEEMFNKDLSELNAYRNIGSIDEINTVFEKSTQVLENNKKEINSLKSVIESYEELGSIDEINVCLDRLTTEVKSYRELGSVEELSEGLDRLSNVIQEQKSIIESYKGLGSVEDVNKLVSVVEGYLEIGNPSEINECLDKLTSEIETYRELGTIDEVNSLLSVVENYTVGESKELIEKYMKIGTPEDILETLTDAKEIVSEYLEIGSISEINDTLDKVEESLTKYSELGSYTELSEVLDQSQAIIESYMQLGTPEEINMALDTILEFTKEVGKPNEIVEILEQAQVQLEKYKSLGTPELIQEALDKALDVISNSKDEEVSEAIVTKSVAKVENKFVSESVVAPKENNIFKSEGVKSVKIASHTKAKDTVNVQENTRLKNVFQSCDESFTKTLSDDTTSVNENVNKSRLVSVFNNI